MLPNWIHAGASKCASSWLWQVCKGHPEIYVPAMPDNVNFFTVHYHRGLNWYEQTYFSAYAGEPVAGEFSNSYLCYPPAAERVAEHLPKVKLTVLLRPPVERAVLSWGHWHLKNKPSGLDMRRGIGFPLERVLHHHGHGLWRIWMEPGFYARHLQNLYRLFPKEQVLVMLHEDLVDDAAAFLRRFYAFLGVDTGYVSPLIGQDVNPDMPDAPDYLPETARLEMIEVFRNDVETLAEMLGRDLSHWLK